MSTKSKKTTPVKPVKQLKNKVTEAINNIEKLIPKKALDSFFSLIGLKDKKSKKVTKGGDISISPATYNTTGLINSGHNTVNNATGNSGVLQAMPQPFSAGMNTVNTSSGLSTSDQTTALPNLSTQAGGKKRKPRAPKKK